MPAPQFYEKDLDWRRGYLPVRAKSGLIAAIQKMLDHATRLTHKPTTRPQVLPRISI